MKSEVKEVVIAPRRTPRCVSAVRPRGAEPVPEPVGQPSGEPPRLLAGRPRPEAFGQRLVDERDRHLLFERLLDRPRPGGAAGDVVGHIAEFATLLAERLLAELQQPRSDDCAVVPRPGDSLQIEVVPALGQQLEPLAVGLHQRVFDAVVDHLHVVARAAGAHPVVAGRSRRHRVEDGCQRLVGPLGAADHQGEAEFGPCRAAGGPAVEVRRVGCCAPPNRILEVGVAAVDDDVVGTEAGFEFVERGVDRVARGYHQPDPLVVAEPVGEVVKILRGRRPRVGCGRDRFRVEVEHHHVVTRVEHAVEDDLSHPAESDNSQFHIGHCDARGGSDCGFAVGWTVRRAGAVGGSVSSLPQRPSLLPRLLPESRYRVGVPRPG